MALLHIHLDDFHRHVSSLKTISCWAAREPVALKDPQVSKLPQALYDWSVEVIDKMEANMINDYDIFWTIPTKYPLGDRCCPEIFLHLLTHMVLMNDVDVVGKLFTYLIGCIINEKPALVSDLVLAIEHLYSRMSIVYSAFQIASIFSCALVVIPPPSVRDVLMKYGALVDNCIPSIIATYVAQPTGLDNRFLEIANGTLETLEQSMVEYLNFSLNGRSLLSYAAQNGELAKVKLILDSHISPMYYDLEAAVKGCQLEVIKVLAERIEMGTYVWQLVHDEGIAEVLYEASLRQSFPSAFLLDNNLDPVVIKFLAQQGRTMLERDPTDELCDAIESINTFDLKFFSDGIARGAELARDNSGRTFLMCAAMAGRAVLMRLFMECGDDIHATDATGRTALHYAAAAGSYLAVKLLLRRNADVGVKDKDGSTPVALALSKNYMEVAEMLNVCSHHA